jgi:hypothetical protein
MNEDEIIKLIDILIGDITPVADSHIDSIRQENIKKLIAIIKHYHKKIDDVLCESMSSPYDSVKKFKSICDEYYDWIGAPDN